MNVAHMDHGTITPAGSWPSISIIKPIDTKIKLKEELLHAIKMLVNKIKHELHNQYAEERYLPVLDTIYDMADRMVIPTDAKSIVIFASPISSKMYFLDTVVKEKVFIDSSFEIRDLIYENTVGAKYVLLLLSADQAKMYRVINGHFDKINLNVSGYHDVFSSENTKEQVLNFTDHSSVKETKLDKFLRTVNAEIESLMHTVHLPVFVLGTDRVVGHFKNITNIDVIDTIRGNYFDASVPELKILLAPYLKNWETSEHKKAIEKLNDAANHQKLAIGLHEVWDAANNKLGQLLVIEKNFSGKEGMTSTGKIFYARDIVDDIIEQVLQWGGKVLFVDDGMIPEYQHIALVKYYPS